MRILNSRKELINHLHLFTQSTLRKAYSLCLDIASVEYDETIIYVIFHSRPEEPTFFLENGKIIAAECSCMTEGSCTHLAALLLYLINDLEESAFQSSRKDTPSPAPKPLIEKARANLFRKVLDLPKLLSYDYYEEPSPYHVNHEVKVYSDRNDELTIAYHANKGYYNAGEDVMIQMKWKENELYLSCNLCEHKTQALCHHQQTLLIDEKTVIIHKFYERSLNIDSYYASSSLEFFSPEILQEKFYILWQGEKEFRLLSKSKNLDIFTSPQMDIRENNPDINLKHPQRQSHIFHQLYQKDNQGFGNAIMWSGGFNLILIQYLEGKLSKNKTKLISYIDLVDNPTLIPYDIQMELEKILRNFDYQIPAISPLMLEKSLTELKNKVDLLSPYIHYVHESSDYASMNVKKQDLCLFHFSKEVLKMELLSEVNEETVVITLQIKRLKKASKNRIPVIYLSLFAVIGDTAYMYDTSTVMDFISSYGIEYKYLFSSKDPDTLRRGVSWFVNEYKIDPAGLDQNWVQIIPAAHRQIQVSQVENWIHFTPLIVGPAPQNLTFEVLSEISHPASEEPYVISVPDQTKVEEFVKWCDELHPRLSKLTSQLGFYAMPIEDFIKDQWFLDFSEICQKEGVEITGWDALKDFSFNPHRGVVEQNLEENSDWFDINFTITFGDIVVPQKEWIRAVRKGERSILLKDGTYGVIPEEWRINTLKLLSSARVEKEKIKLSKLHFNALEHYVDLSENPKIRKEIEQKKSRLVNFKGLEKFDLPKSINAELRPYQKDGYNWLRFLNEYQFGGCLADDMGLGKTLQVLSLLADQKEKGQSASLVVVPRTLMYNWVAEIEKFCPDLSYLVHHGPGRGSDPKEFSSYDVIISVYGTVTRDIRWLRDYPFHYIILDESQAIKNPASLRYKSIMQLQSKHKLTMTGTPIENSTMDLFAQFNFINPGLLGNKSLFQKNFADAIEKNGSEEARNLLQKIIHPFILRRTKSQVTRDLPAKTEMVLYCEMEEEQKTLYEKVKNEIRSSLLDHDQLEKNKILVLEGLLKLRQICNSPLLLNQKDAEPLSSKTTSVKIETLMEQIQEVVGEEKHSILVFSQFTSMLSLIRERLEKENYTYTYLDGSTTNRKKVIDEFNSRKDIHIFLLSLKAGNVGLNLTKADFVYLIDPWWNPAVEAQAIDRTHRIGQTKPVFAYRLICKDTVEEKILKLQSRKTKLADDLIQTDENVFKSLDREELISLFE